MEIIKIADFVSNHAHANSKITNFENNKLIIKGDTGIGGTTALLKVTDKNIIIISPLAGMISGKEKKREPHQMFIYQGSLNRWHHYDKELSAGHKVILNTTPEQIIELKKLYPDLYKKVMKIPFFIDESQVYAESDYRASMPKFYDILFSEHKGNFTFSTATPTYQNLDIPKEFLEKMEIIRIEPEVKRVKEITITKLNNYWEFVKTNCENGNKVVLFTNDLKKINNVINEENLAFKTQILVGETLRVKASGIKTKDYNEYDKLINSKVDDSADIYILSTKYLIGFDLDFDASIGIIIDKTSFVDSFNVNQAVQAYGRVRNKVKEAKIFYNCPPSTFTIDINQIESEIRKIPLNENYLKNIQPHIKHINYSLTYPKSNLVKSLEDYGFKVLEDENENALIYSFTTFPMMYKNLINQIEPSTFIIGKELEIIYNKIKGDDPFISGYDTKYLLLWATAYMAFTTQSKYLLEAKAERFERLLTTAKAFIDVNDLAYPEQLSDLDKITKYRVTKTEMECARRAGAECESYSEEFLISDSANAYTKSILEAINSEYKKDTYSKYVTLSNTDTTFSKAKQIINSLYAIHLVEKEEFDEGTKRIIHGFSVVSETIINDYVSALSDISNKNVQEILDKDDKEDLEKLTIEYAKELKGKKIFNNTNRKIIVELKKLNGWDIRNKTVIAQFNQIMDRAERIKKSLLDCKMGIRNTIKMNTYNIKIQKERHKNFILSLLSLSCAGHTFGFKSTSIDNRIFNTATKTTRQLRPYTPYKIIQCDIKSAFASFVDTIVGSNISQKVYENIMDKYNIKRDEAKTLYNTMLNNNCRNTLEARKFYRDCGYTSEQVTKIVRLTSAEKGSFYKTMTKMEEKLIEDFKHINGLEHINSAVRLHDAVIMYDTPDNQNLTLEIDNYKFEMKKF